MAMMISKFHKLIASKVFWGIFALVISVSFVGVSIPGCMDRSTRRSAQERDQLAGRMFGEKVSRVEFSQSFKSTYLSYTIMFQRPIQLTDEINDVLHTAAWQRIAILKKAQQLNMSATPDQVRELIQNQPIFQNQQTGQFDKTAYDTFVNGYLPRTGMNVADMEQMFAEQVLVDKISTLASQGAIVQEDEIKKAFHLYTDLITVEYGAVSRSLAPEVSVTDEEAKLYFAQNEEQFRMPEKVKVNYVQFAVADFSGTEEVTEEIIARFYESNKQQYVKENADATAAPEYKLLEEVRDDIHAIISTELARREAISQADILVSTLADETMTFKKATEELGLTLVKNTPSFTMTDAVNGIDLTAPFQRSAFLLQDDESHYYSDPVVGRDFVYVLELTKKYPSFLPSFEVVQEDATEAAKLAANETAYVVKAQAIHAEVKAALQAGTSFEKATEKYKLELKTTEPFNATTTLSDEFGTEIMNGSILTDLGKLAELISTPDEYLLAYVAKKDLGDEAAELASMRPQLVRSISAEKASQLIAAWRENLLKEADFVDLSDRSDEDNS
jgi:hypothetical protein